MAEKKEFLMTPEELEQLKNQIDYLKNEKRREIAERINQARGYGDLSENSEYDAAKEEQAENETILKDLEERLKYAKVISSDSLDFSTVNVGVTVRIKNLDTKKEVEYTITGTLGANPMQNRISNESPIAQALIGRRVGETVEAEVPKGIVRMEILDIVKK
ncbi:MAG: transcription elongation factor GreA [Clostridia bacterium]|nr:transcription elongation factor GreA [Clostridia bacterium]